jgi:pseudouridine kinase
MPICSQYQLVNASGCGDAFVAAVVWQYLKGGTVEQMAKAGVCAASVCGNSKDTVCPDINEELLCKLMKN